MVTKLNSLTTVSHLTLSVSLFVLVGCNSFKPRGANPSGPQVISQWIRPTVESGFKSHRKMNRMSPIVTEKLVFQANNIGSLIALDRKSGRVIWSKDFKGGVEAGAVLFKELLFVAANDGTVSALHASSGTQVWSYTSSSENVSAPVLDPSTGLLYFQNSQNILYCLEADTGRQVWVYSKPDSSLMTIRGSSTPTVHKGMVFAGFSEGSFVALKASQGQLIWEQNLNRNKKFRDMDAQAYIDGDQVFISGYNDRLYSLKIENGQILWSYEAGSYSAVTSDGSHLYLSTTESEVVKLKKENGEVVWKISNLKGLATQVSLLGSWVVFGESHGKLLFADSKTGKIGLSFETGRGLFSKPTVLNDSKEVFAVSNEAYLYNLKIVEEKNSFDWLTPK